MTSAICEIKRVSEVYLNFTHSDHFYFAKSKKKKALRAISAQAGYARAEDLSEQNLLLNLMVEQPDPRERHGHAVLVACLDDVVVTDRTAGFCDVLNAALVSALNVVAEREESVRTDGYVCILCDPLLLLFHGQYLRLNFEKCLPYAVSQYIIVLFGNVNVDGVVTDRTADVVNKLKSHDLRMLSEPPDVCLVSCKSGAVDPGLLSCADTDALAVLYVADRVALCVLECNE